MDHKKGMVILLSSMFFVTSNGSISEAESFEDIKVNLESVDSGNVTFKESAKVKTPFDSKIMSSNEASQDFNGEKIPKVNLDSGTLIPKTNKEIEIPFTQPLDSTDEALYAHDLVIKQLGLTNTPTLIPVMDYTTRVEGNKIIVTFLVDYTDVFSVQVKDPSFIHSNGNLASPSEVYITTSNTPVTIESPKVSLESGTRIQQSNKEIEIPFTQSLDSIDEALYANDLVIKQLGLTNTPTLIPIMDYTTRVEGNKIIVTFLVDYTDEYAVQVRDALFIRSNGIPAVQSEYYTTTKNDQSID
ncbi:hypothetical protein [Paenibacillus taichungensis]|uniref:hypothetical protein n=1 Tax=Paenibacillus taichungensis TaxID=484184 RepID=UPI00287264E6|nr:hypothetical protein [Paenibacillus taichungensis]MDR9747696.1 hypothetical protein [Paenibacillus taichungensis]